jgi:hypothetical protein
MFIACRLLDGQAISAYRTGQRRAEKPSSEKLPENLAQTRESSLRG